ncbi:tRNA (adenine(37)-N6)-methyltransferase-like [Rhynchophorus ferrugineus]|uniref:tRNA (adenine(37)-N6)-methyltransferase-like n=1 Tax=Rhynchophorus ferrugineus TaxID=354439 RepID=UPI003FCDAD4C
MTDKKIEQLQEQLLLARREIHNLRQQLSALNHVHQKDVKNIYLTLDRWQCNECRNRYETENNSTTEGNNEFKFKPIGIISTHFPEKRGTPRQPGICKDTIAKLTLNKEVFTNPYHALEGLQEFSHMWILFHFHKNEATHVRAKVAPPRLNGIRTGVFATRSPHRPCPIGLSLVKIDRIMDRVIYFSGVDMIDQTPVFDIKPYIPHYDNPGLCNTLNISGSGDMMDSTIESDNGSRNNSLTEEIAFDSSQLQNVSQSRANVPSPSTREMDGQENERQNQNLEVHSPGSVRNEIAFNRTSSRIGEREAPDGEEEESTNTQSTNNTVPIQGAPASGPSTSSGHVRIPSWIDHAPVSRLNVSFKERAISQLQELGPEGEEKQKIITNVLQEDPRSVYLRERWGGHCYVFRIAELYVSCKFNDGDHSVIVYQIFQNERQAEGDD